jgi:hypothetical protein
MMGFKLLKNSQAKAEGGLLCQLFFLTALPLPQAGHNHKPARQVPQYL